MLEYSQTLEAAPLKETPVGQAFDGLDQFRSSGSKDINTGNAASEKAADLPELSLASAKKPEEGPAAEAGSTVYATDGVEMLAKAGSTVYAEKGSTVIAEKGAVVYARNGSEVFALDGTSINAEKGPTIHQDKGSKVYVQFSATVDAYKDSVVYTAQGNVNAYNGSVVLASFDKDQAEHPPTIHAKGKCTLYVTKGVNVSVENGAQTLVKSWDGKTDPK